MVEHVVLGRSSASRTRCPPLSHGCPTLPHGCPPLPHGCPSLCLTRLGGRLRQLLGCRWLSRSEKRTAHRSALSSHSFPLDEDIICGTYCIGTPVCWEIWCIMNKSLLANIEVDGSCVWVDLVDVMVAMVDQVLLQVSKPESGLGSLGQNLQGVIKSTCNIRSRPATHCSSGW